MNAAVFAETVRRHVTSAGYVAFVILVAMLGLFSSTFQNAAVMWPSLIGLLSIITGAALIGPEFSTGTLQLIVSKPVRRWVYVVSRAAGALAAVALAAIVPLLIESAVRVFVRSGEVPWARLGAAFVNSIAGALLTIALLTMLGSMTRAYFNVAIYFGVQVGLSVIEAILGMTRVRGGQVGRVIEANPAVEKALTAVQNVLFPARPETFDGAWLARVAVTALIALAIACVVFERREVPYGAE